MKEDGKPVVSFGAGEPDFNTPQYILDAAKTALDKGLTKYTPASGTVALRQAIAQKLQADNGLRYDPAQIVVSNGAKHSLCNAFMAILDPGDEVLIPAPYWLTYPELVKLADGVPVILHTDERNSFKLTPAQLKAAITPKTKALIFNNPSNPTGVVYTESEIRALAAVLEQTDIYIVSDEIYEKLVYDGLSAFSIAACSPKLQEQTIVVNGVSKTYSMTGWRIGYTASNAAVAKAMGSMQSHMTSNPNSIAQYATLEALTHSEGLAFLETMKKTFDERRKLITERLGKIDKLTYIHPQGAFYVMVSIKNILGRTACGVRLQTALDVANVLIDRYNVAVIPCESFGAPDYLRLSYAIGADDIVRGLDSIAQFVSDLQ